MSGFIQFFDFDHFSIGMWSKADVEMFHERCKAFPIIIDVTCGIVASVNDRRIFYFLMINGNDQVKTEPMPVFQVLTDKPDEQHLRLTLDRFLTAERKRFGRMASVKQLIAICDIS